MSECNGENLVSFATRTTDEQREIAKKGGIKSGQVRREQGMLRKAIETALLTADSSGLTALEEGAVATVSRWKSTGCHATLGALASLLGENKVQVENSFVGENATITIELENED